ncbi:11654_t:CDS:2, partial [Dentiscutata heterogama]
NGSNGEREGFHFNHNSEFDQNGSNGEREGFHFNHNSEFDQNGSNGEREGFHFNHNSEFDQNGSNGEREGFHFNHNSEFDQNGSNGEREGFHFNHNSEFNQRDFNDQNGSYLGQGGPNLDGSTFIDEATVSSTSSRSSLYPLHQHVDGLKVNSSVKGGKFGLPSCPLWMGSPYKVERHLNTTKHKNGKCSRN